MKQPLLLSLVFCIAFSLSAEEKMESWQDIQGRKFEAEIVSVRPGFVRLRNSGGKEIDFQIPLLVPAHQQRVRDWEVKKKKADEPSAFAKDFQDDLVIRDGKKVKKHKPEDLGKVKYFVFYRSASWCGPCRRFTPKLVKFYEKMKKDHPEFELIFISSDRSSDAMKEYMKEDKMPWPAFKHGKHKNVVTSYGNGIPCLIITDAFGKKLHDSYTKDKKYRGPGAVLDDLKKLLEE